MDEQVSVTFYHWLGKQPSQEAISIAGGGRVSWGSYRYAIPKLAQFFKGACTTSDPEIIEALRLLATNPQSCITEDRDVFDSHVLAPVDRASHQAEAREELEKDNFELRRRLDAITTGENSEHSPGGKDFDRGEKL